MGHRRAGSRGRLLFVGLSIASPHFLTCTNLSSVVRQTAVINIMALGMTLVIISGGIDLSDGAILAMEHGAPIAVGVVAGVAAGLICDCINGVPITRLKIAPFIVTLGTLGIVLWLLMACTAAMHIILEHSKLGRYSFAIGSNEEAAYYAGIPVAFHTSAVYAICGMLTGLAGNELQAIAAVVIGGGSLRGGEGSVLGTLVGAFIMGLLSNGSDLLGVSPYVQQAIIGAVIILAVTVDELRKRKAV